MAKKENFDIITFGSAVVDVFIQTDVHEHQKEMCYPVGGKILINELKFSIGGGGTNTAVAFSRLGLKTGCICKLGDDENGNKILNCLKNEKIVFLGRKDKKEMTGYSVILDSKGGERTILTYKGANNKITTNEIKLNNIKTKWIYYTALLEKSFDTQKKLARILSNKGVKIAYNPSFYIINNEPIKDILNYTDVLILNNEEGEALKKRYELNGDAIDALHKLGPKIVVITDKDNPAICSDGIKKYSIVPHKNIKVVERTGAGDAFASGFIAGQVVGWPIQKCLELGLKESESVITSRGAKNNLLKMKLRKK